MNNPIEGEELFGNLDLGRAVYPGMQAGRPGLNASHVETWQHESQKYEGLGGHLVLGEIDHKRGVEHYLGVADVKELHARHSLEDLWRMLELGHGDILGLPKSALMSDDGVSMPALARSGTGFAPITIPLNASTRLHADVKFLRLRR